MNIAKKILSFVVLVGFSFSLIVVPGQSTAFGATTNNFTGLIISWEESKETSDQIFIRTHEVDHNSWTRWYLIEADEDVQTDSHKKETLFSTNLSDKYEYYIESEKESPDISNIKVETILSTNQGETQKLAGVSISSSLRVISRKEWGANEAVTIRSPQPKVVDLSLATTSEGSDAKTEVKEADPEISRIVENDENGNPYVWPLQYATDIKFIVVHHTASVSNLDKPKLAIQNIMQYHAVSRGWGDIGYNYIIDTQGNIYEGRKGGKDIVGGHAKPVNKTSIGIAVLGDYEQNTVPLAVTKNLMSLIRQQAKEHNINVLGKTIYKDKTYDNVQGHQDNTATTCPGRYLMQELGGIKDLIAYSSVKTENDSRAFSDFEQRPILVASATEDLSFTLRLRNTGTSTWNSNTFLERVETNYAKQFPKVMARLKEESVAPGAIGTFTGKIPSQFQPGLFVPTAKLVMNGSVRSIETLPIPVASEGATISYTLVGRSDPPAVMKSGETALAWVMLKNTGDIPWKRNGTTRVRIGTVRDFDRKSGLVKGKTRIATLREPEVKPGETGTFSFRITAPKTGGTYTEYFAPVMERVGWMPDTGMHFTVNVQSDETPLRVLLGFDKNFAQISSVDGMKLYEGNILRKRILANESVYISLSSTGTNVSYNDGNSADYTRPIRLVSEKDGGPLTLVNFENRPEWNTKLNDNMFRGVLELRDVDQKLAVINELPLEDYLKGIAEVSNSDPKEKIKTITILARSYAMYYRDIGTKFPGKPYHLDDNPDHTQKYRGYGVEIRANNVVAAVNETRGKIINYNKKLVIAPYFNQSDGRTRSANEAWGWTHTPYLQSVPDTFCGTKELKGHGVGLSGCGATELAKQGKSAEEIIKYYYTGIEITDGM